MDVSVLIKHDLQIAVNSSTRTDPYLGNWDQCEREIKDGGFNGLGLGIGLGLSPKAFMWTQPTAEDFTLSQPIVKAFTPTQPIAKVPTLTHTESFQLSHQHNQ